MTSELDALVALLTLERLPRTGWILCGIPQPESVAAHSFGTALVALALGPAVDPPLDVDRAAILGLVHDTPEVLLGDIPRAGAELLPPGAKAIAEERALRKVLGPLSDLAEERGTYSSYKGSLWDQGILPIDSIKILRENRGDQYLDQDETETLDWESVRERVKRYGMRNSNCMAIAPTATIANITGVAQSIEPTYQNLYVKSNLSSEFTVANPYLVDDLKALDLWDEVMANDLKYYDGSVQAIDRVPNDLKVLYKCAFEIDAKWLIEAGSRRQKWIDQAQSLNLYMAEASGPKLDELYKFAWKKGLKTTYYLRTMGATHTEKSTITDHRLNAVNNGGRGSGGTPVAGGTPSAVPPAAAGGMATASNGNGSGLVEAQPTAPRACSIEDPDCEACQ